MAGRYDHSVPPVSPLDRPEPRGVPGASGGGGGGRAALPSGGRGEATCGSAAPSLGGDITAFPSRRSRPRRGDRQPGPGPGPGRRGEEVRAVRGPLPAEVRPLLG